MKATIKILTAEKEFTNDQLQIMKRIAMVLIEHNLSVSIRIKEDKNIEIPIETKLKIV